MIHKSPFRPSVPLLGLLGLGMVPGGVVACSSDGRAATEEEREVGAASAALFGPGANTVDTSLASNAVGQFQDYGALPEAGGCTATLIAPKKVLTAGHCIHDPTPGTLASVFFPDGVPKKQFRLNGEWYPVTGWSVHPKYLATGDTPSDLAVVQLGSAVPPTVAAPVKVHPGDCVGELKNGTLHSPKVVGFGGDSFTCSKEWIADTLKCGVNVWLPSAGGAFVPCNTDGIRRSGLVYDLDSFDDECSGGVLGFLDGPCIDGGRLWLAPYSSQTARTAPGDSGGPLFASDASNTEYVIGVTSGTENLCAGTPWASGNIQSTWAETCGGGNGNAAFIFGAAPEIVVDRDGDGIPDAFDDCPNDPDPGQDDLDHDFVGDACDNCPPKACATPNKCANPGQKDADADRVGDICDPCPVNSKFTASPGDADMDGTPNECDLNGNAVDGPIVKGCTGPSGCPKAPGQSCLQDGPNGTCTKQVDADFDGIPDVNDLCLAFQSENNDNTNAIAETTFNASVMGDPCDLAPSVKIAAEKVPYGPQQSEVFFGAVSVLGRQTLTSQFRSYNGQQRFRACECVDSQGVSLPFGECTKAGGLCSAATLYSNAPWRTISLAADDGTPVPAAGKTTWFTNDGDGSGVTSRYEWSWQADVKSGVFGVVKSQVLSPGGFRAVVRSNTDPPPPASPPFPQTPGRDGNPLNDSYSIVPAGAYAIPVPQPFGKQIPDCFGIGCGFEIDDPRDYLRLRADPWDPRKAWQSPSLGFVRNGKILTTEGSNKLLDLTPYVPDALRDALVNPSTRWTAAVEPELPVGLPRALVLPGTFGATTAPSRVSFRDGGLYYDTYSPYVSVPDGGESVHLPGAAIVTVETPSLGGPVTPLTGFVAAFSATHARVLIAGGATANGFPSSLLWKFDYADGGWRRAIQKASPAPPGEVLDMTYDPEGQIAYVLGVDGRVASLVAYDLRADTARVLFNVPYLKFSKAVYLTLLPGGQLAVTASRQGSHDVYRFDPATKQVTGVLGGQGGVVSKPHFRGGQLWLPTVHGQTFAFAAAKPFKSGRLCQNL